MQLFYRDIPNNINLNFTNMKKIVFLIAASVLLASCGTQMTILPKALNTVNSVSLDELNLEREDYDILNTVSAEATVIYRGRGSQIEIIDQNNEFSLIYTKTKIGWVLKHSGILKLGYLSNDYTYDGESIIQPEEVVRRLAMYRLINVAKTNGADGIIEPIISTNIEQSGKDILYKTNVEAKIIRLHTNN